MVRFRSVVILIALALPALATAQDNGWKPIFDGKDMNGWQHVGPGSFSVQDGMLTTHGGMGLLWYTPAKISNAQIRVVFKTAGRNSNSGVFIRIPEKPTEAWMPVNKGYEIQIDNTGDDYHCTGVVYSFTKALARPQKDPGEWNTMLITLDGPHTQVELNGVKVTDYTEGDPVQPRHDKGDPAPGPRPDSGYIGLQNHPGNPSVTFKEVSIRSLGH